MSNVTRIRRFGPSAMASGREPLDDGQLRALVPSAFAADKHESRSARYTYIPTIEVIDGLRANGFLPFSARQGKSRVPGKEDFTKHLIRFRHMGAEGQAARKVGDVFPEVVLLNSHDGTSSYQIMAGTMRLVCLNGMVVSDKEFGNIKVPHKGNIVDQVIEGSYTVIEESRRAVEVSDAWAGVPLSVEERLVMAEAAHVLRFGEPEEGADPHPVTPNRLLAVRRPEDSGNSLFHAANVIQENLIRGGLSAWGRDANNRPRRVTTRPVNAIDGDVRLNRALWHLAERMAEIKAAA